GRLVDAPVAGIAHLVLELAEDPAALDVDRMPRRRIERHLAAGKDIHRRDNPVADLLAAVHRSVGVLDVGCVLGELVGEPRPVPAGTDLYDNLLMALEGRFDLVARPLSIHAWATSLMRCNVLVISLTFRRCRRKPPNSQK